MSVTFTQTEGGSAAITIDNPAHPWVPGKRPRQSVGRTAGSGFKVLILDSSDDQQIRLRFQQMDNTDYEALRDFIYDDINWHQYKFSYTDHEATVHTNLRYGGGLPEFQTVPDAQPALWNGTLTLIKDLG